MKYVPLNSEIMCKLFEIKLLRVRLELDPFPPSRHGPMNLGIEESGRGGRDQEAGRSRSSSNFQPEPALDRGGERTLCGLKLD